jgi:hypothetical protein
VVTNATIMWEDEGVDAFYSCYCEDTIYWNATSTESGRNRLTGVPSTHFCEAEIVFGQPPCYPSSVDIFVEVAKEDYVVVIFFFHCMSWVINCSKKMVLGECASPRAVKYRACWTLMVVSTD